MLLWECRVQADISEGMDGLRETSTGWHALEAELDAWATDGHDATFWWRDDDATGTGDALERLLRTGATVPLAIAAIPVRAEHALAERARAQDGRVFFLQHGFAHCNHAPAASKKSEYGADRPIELMLAEIAEGRARMSEVFAHAVRPVFVPPWNRIDDGLAKRLGELGFKAISTFGVNSDDKRPRRLNTHVDIIDWSGKRGFVGERVALDAIVGHLVSRRRGTCRRNTATGLLTHHLEHDEEAWRFLDRLFEVTTNHRAARWLDVEALLETTP